jgi:hypothetical protein
MDWIGLVQAALTTLELINRRVTHRDEWDERVRRERDRRANLSDEERWYENSRKRINNREI